MTQRPGHKADDIRILSGTQHIVNAGFLNSLNCIRLNSVKARLKGYDEKAVRCVWRGRGERAEFTWEVTSW